MPDSSTPRRDDGPTEGFTTARLADHPGRPARLFLPADYQPKYAYPLVVLFHPDGADEEAAARLAPLLSRRNYVVACPRGPVGLGAARGGRGYGWGDGRDAAFLTGLVAHARRACHVHPDRVYLIGFGEGAAAAYRLAGEMGGVAGVVALNGTLPHRPKAVRGLRAFVGHGASNPVVPLAAARRAARRLAAAGADVRFAAYPTTGRPHADMFRDVNRWIMSAVNPGPDAPHGPPAAGG